MPTNRSKRTSFEECKMVLVLRGELRLTAGKAAVQAAHAAVLLVERPEVRSADSFEAWRRKGADRLGRGRGIDRGRPGHTNLSRHRPVGVANDRRSDRWTASALTASGAPVVRTTTSSELVRARRRSTDVGGSAGSREYP